MRNAPAGQVHFVGTIGGDAAPVFLQARLNVFRLFGAKSVLFLPLHLYLLWRICKKHGIHIIHAHHRYFDLAGSILGKILGIPVVTSVHSKVSSKRMFSYSAGAFIVPGETIRQHLIERFKIPSEKITLINNFVVPSDYGYDEKILKKLRENYHIPENRTVLLFIGRFSKEKGVDILVNSMRKLMHEFSDLFIVLAGDGEERKFLKTYCDRHIVNYAIVEPQNQPGALYALADIVVLPSRVDPFPLVMLEAGIMKKPFIGSRVDGIAEVITHKLNGYLVEPDSRDALVKGMDEVLSNGELRASIAEKHFERVQSGFLHTVQLPKYESFYKTLLNAHGN